MLANHFPPDWLTVTLRTQALKDLERAYTNFFEKRSAFPRFKRKSSGDSFRFPDPKQVKLDQGSSRLFLPKLGYIRDRNKPSLFSPAA